MLAYCQSFSPTLALTTSISLRRLKDPAHEFPFIRVLASLGWIAAGAAIGILRVETSATPFLATFRRKIDRCETLQA